MARNPYQVPDIYYTKHIHHIILPPRQRARNAFPKLKNPAKRPETFVQPPRDPALNALPGPPLPPSPSLPFLHAPPPKTALLCASHHSSKPISPCASSLRWEVQGSVTTIPLPPLCSVASEKTGGCYCRNFDHDTPYFTPPHTH